ncbi:uncharacterized protein LOC118436517 [Folsomia candida]|uniref:uncharacterized protein LOC118436517 n=1 Tax=Folsomia candida TaxID=158441 RepID=UPI00160503D5|nr:uncharacterized protein LOC118436517 [Folsomia candida]
MLSCKFGCGTKRETMSSLAIHERQCRLNTSPPSSATSIPSPRVEISQVNSTKYVDTSGYVAKSATTVDIKRPKTETVTRRAIYDVSSDSDEDFADGGMKGQQQRAKWFTPQKNRREDENTGKRVSKSEETRERGSSGGPHGNVNPGGNGGGDNYAVTPNKMKIKGEIKYLSAGRLCNVICTYYCFIALGDCTLRAVNTSGAMCQVISGGDAGGGAAEVRFSPGGSSGNLNPSGGGDKSAVSSRKIKIRVLSDSPVRAATTSRGVSKLSSGRSDIGGEGTKSPSGGTGLREVSRAELEDINVSHQQVLMDIDKLEEEISLDEMTDMLKDAGSDVIPRNIVWRTCGKNESPRKGRSHYVHNVGPRLDRPHLNHYVHLPTRLFLTRKQLLSGGNRIYDDARTPEQKSRQNHTHMIRYYNNRDEIRQQEDEMSKHILYFYICIAKELVEGKSTGEVWRMLGSMTSSKLNRSIYIGEHKTHGPIQARRSHSNEENSAVRQCHSKGFRIFEGLAQCMDSIDDIKHYESYYIFALQRQAKKEKGLSMLNREYGIIIAPDFMLKAFNFIDTGGSILTFSDDTTQPNNFYSGFVCKKCDFIDRTHWFDNTDTV